LYALAVGVAAAPLTLHTRTVTVPEADTHAFHVNPAPGSDTGLTATAIAEVELVTLATSETHAPAQCVTNAFNHLSK
jgi:hypothetical protein